MIEVDRTLIQGCLNDMRACHTYLVEINKTFKIPIYTHAVLLALRIVELESALGDPE